jgi:methionyl aminopeptidase
MRLTASREPFGKNGFFTLKGPDWLEKQRVAGKIVAESLFILQSFVKEKTKLSLLEMNSIVEDFIVNSKCIPTFKNYKGFPAGVCISVNNQLVHGIPVDYHLQEGDVVKFDLGATFEGAIADSALTCIYGEPKKSDHVRIVSATEESLMEGIKAISVGKKLGCIGYAIYKSAKGRGYNVIEDYGGHGLEWNKPHAPPFVANKASLDEGIRIQPGLAIAIEPMLVTGSIASVVDKDGWTVVTKEIGAHFEHSVYVHEDHVEIITDRKFLESNASH